MKSKRFKIIISILVLLLTVSCFFVACDSSSGRSDFVYLKNFRGNGDFVLPIKVKKSLRDPGLDRLFNSKLSLSEICESVNGSEDFEAFMFKDCVVVRDVSNKKLGYCIIRRQIVTQYNYVAENMVRVYYSSASESYGLFLAVPFHMVSIIISDENRVLTENTEYEFSGTKEELVSFYEESGYEVSDSENGIIVEDVTGIKYGDNVSFDDVVKKFEIKINDSTVSYQKLD